MGKVLGQCGAELLAVLWRSMSLSFCRCGESVEGGAQGFPRPLARCITCVKRVWASSFPTKSGLRVQCIGCQGCVLSSPQPSHLAAQPALHCSHFSALLPVFQPCLLSALHLASLSPPHSASTWSWCAAPPLPVPPTQCFNLVFSVLGVKAPQIMLNWRRGDTGAIQKGRRGRGGLQKGEGAIGRVSRVGVGGAVRRQG